MIFSWNLIGRAAFVRRNKSNFWGQICRSQALFVRRIKKVGCITDSRLILGVWHCQFTQPTTA